MILIGVVLLNPAVLVLALIASSDGGFPARLVALLPFRGGVEARGRIALPGLAVGLALILALLVDDHLLALAAGRKSDRQRERSTGEDQLGHHDFAPAGAAFWSGLP